MRVEFIWLVLLSTTFVASSAAAQNAGVGSGGLSTEQFRDLAESLPQMPAHIQLGSGDAIVFEGCAKHVCPDVFSVLLYDPAARAAFTAKYVWGKITYSPSLNSPKDALYKEALEQLIHERRDE